MIFPAKLHRISGLYYHLLDGILGGGRFFVFEIGWIDHAENPSEKIERQQ